jgi:hypothetical protein
MPFANGSFDSASCFLGLQDVEIGFGDDGVQAVMAESVRVLSAGGVLTLLDEFPFERLEALLVGLPVRVTDRADRGLDVRWDRQAAEQAVALYAEGWTAQAGVEDEAERKQIACQAHRRMAAEMECQLDTQGYYAPFGPVRMVVAIRSLAKIG